MRGFVSMFILGTLLAGSCGGGNGQALDCAWVQAPDNCWKKALAEVAMCSPQRATGSLSADGLTCSYSTGETVRFESSARMFDTAEVHLEVSKNGARCLRFSSSEVKGKSSLQTIETASGKVAAEAHVTSCSTCADYTITCPDGTAYHTDNAFGILSCGSPSKVPFGLVTQTSSDTFGLDLPGGGDGQVSLFYCKK